MDSSFAPWRTSNNPKEAAELVWASLSEGCSVSPVHQAGMADRDLALPLFQLYKFSMCSLWELDGPVWSIESGCPWPRSQMTRHLIACFSHEHCSLIGQDENISKSLCMTEWLLNVLDGRVCPMLIIYWIFHSKSTPFSCGRNCVKYTSRKFECFDAKIKQKHKCLHTYEVMLCNFFANFM